MDTHGSTSKHRSADGSGSPSPISGERSGEDDLRILLVEDDDGDAQLVSDELSERLAGAEIIRCRTLRDALADRWGDLDCILLDLGLPDTSGLDAVIELRARVSSTPLVVLTGLDDEAMGVAAV